MPNNVELVDIKSAPIASVAAQGLHTEAQFYPLDVLVFATGFDAMTGALERIDIHGRRGQLLRARWDSGPATLLGI